MGIRNYITSFCKTQQSYFFFLAFTSLVFGLLIITSNFVNNRIAGFNDIALAVVHWGVVTFAYFFLIYLISLNRWLFLILFPFINSISAAFAFFCASYDIMVNVALIESVFNTNSEEVSALISLPLVSFVFFVLALSVGFALYRFYKIQPTRHLLHISIIVIGIFVCKEINSLKFNSIMFRLPFSVAKAYLQYQKERKIISTEKKDISQGASCQADSLIVVLILGESTRADHLKLNGYQRNTNPLLQNEDVISFPRIYSEWTHTNKSVPLILTRADSSDYTRSYTEKSFISIFNYCNFDTYWIGNQEPGDTYIYFINECDTMIINNPFHTPYNMSKKTDGELLPIFDSLMLSSNSRKLVILHTIGSHWFYPSHYPDEFEIFTPVIKSKNFNSSDSLLVINAYDNTVLYADFFMSAIINRLKNSHSIVFFLSDHGEILGEEGKWLHAQDTDYERNPAFILWMSENYKQQNPVLYSQAQANKSRHFRTDFMFHSILQAASIRSPYFDAQLSIFEADTLACNER